ncbi:MAG: hypothetical protein GF341_01215 [candidate division Zixibacteria bacterium]|nr:hypothetical protein [candidate division Zixibacteria bacterium]
MRLRDILILVGLIVVILGLTVAEKYAQRNREEQRQQEMALELEMRREQSLEAFRQRWVGLSDSLRLMLDSMASEVMSAGVSEESLAVMVVEQPPETVYVEADPEPEPEPVPEEDVADLPDTNAPAIEDTVSEADVEAEAQAEEDALAVRVAGEYHEALRALPSDLNAYELRVATNEVASLIRARYNLSPDRLDALLKRAAALEE